MTATTTKSGQKRLDSCALQTLRWAKIAENPRKNTCTLHETATPVDAANAELENYGKIRQLHHKTKILGKYRLRFFMYLKNWEFTISVARDGAPVVSTGPDIGCYTVQSRAGGMLGWLVGFPIDLERRILIDGPLVTGMTHAGDSDRFAKAFLQTLGGRFLWVATLPEGARIYPDSTASVPCVFDAASKVAGGSTPQILPAQAHDARFNDRLVSHMRVTHEGWLPSGQTAHHGVERLLPNHYLDLTIWQSRRFRRSDDLMVPMSLDDAAEQVTETIRAQIEALTRGPRKVVLALTAGRDSRMVAAAARPYLDQIEFVTLTSGSGTDVDTVLPRRMVRDLRLRHRELPRMQADVDARDSYILRGGSCVAGVNSWLFPSVAPLRDSHVFVGGTGGELSRGFFWNEGDGSHALNGASLLAQFGMPFDDGLAQRLDDWLAGLGSGNRHRVLDMAYLEQREGCWASAQFPCDPSLVRYQPLLAGPAVTAMLGLSYADKRRAALVDRVIARSWPELGTYRFNSLGPVRDNLAKVQRVLRDPEVVLRRIRRFAS